jgi:NAD(P)H-dependent FMN reductase
MKPITILAISGSLRTASSNASLLNALAAMLPANARLVHSAGLEEIPAFNPDHDRPETIVPSVARFREQIASADAILICTPEYAFGVPGALKNALDWTVSSGSLNGKPVAAISASPLYTGGSHALASLLLTLKALGTITDAVTSLSVPSVNKIFSESGAIQEETVARPISLLLQHLCTAAETREREQLD